MRTLSFDDARALLEEDRSAVLFGLLSCEPCQAVKAILASLVDDDVPGWQVGSCELPARIANALVDQGFTSGYPVLIARLTETDVRTLQGLPNGDAAIRRQVVIDLLMRDDHAGLAPQPAPL